MVRKIGSRKPPGRRKKEIKSKQGLSPILGIHSYFGLRIMKEVKPIDRRKAKKLNSIKRG